MKNLILHITILAIVFTGCRTSNRYLTHRYKFSDSNFRNITIEFREDSTFLLLNSVSGSLSYSFVGQWKKIDDNNIVLINPSTELHKYNKRENAPAPGGRIDTRLASEDRSYIFPVITIDSISFEKSYKMFSLMGYTFRKASKIKD